MTDDTPTRASGISKRGFASMDPTLQRELARRGGAAVKPQNRSFSKNPGLAAEAGRKGGEAGRGKRQKPAAEPLRPQDDFGIHPMR